MSHAKDASQAATMQEAISDIIVLLIPVIIQTNSSNTANNAGTHANVNANANTNSTNICYCVYVYVSVYFHHDYII